MPIIRSLDQARHFARYAAAFMLALGVGLVIEIAGHSDFFGSFKKFHDLDTSAIFVLPAIWLLAVAFFWRAERASGKLANERAKLFVTLATQINEFSYQVAKRDQILFEHLNTFLLKSSDERLTSVSTSMAIIVYGIDSILDHAASTLTALTGSQCATSIKIVHNINMRNRTSRDLDAGDIELKTFSRDSSSKVDRARYDDRTTRVADSTILEKIFVERNTTFAAEYLPAKNEYKDSIGGWQSEYSSVIAVEIRALEPREEKAFPLYGVFLADNKSGGLDTDICREYMRSWSWKLALSLYQLEQLGGEARRLMERRIKS